uniref:Uncharacterized protein n=1 Tax=Onchocerca volvulus TaxID=6282 RepID=A0A8R1TNA2_ONCVO
MPTSHLKQFIMTFYAEIFSANMNFTNLKVAWNRIAINSFLLHILSYTLFRSNNNSSNKFRISYSK